MFSITLARRDTETHRGLKLLIVLAALAPATVLVIRLLREDRGPNPIEALNQETGQWALRLLLLSLAITPCHKLTGWAVLIQIRRLIGLLGFFYAALHLGIFIGAEHFFAWGDIFEDIVKRPYVTLGLAAFLVLVPLSVTSNRKMMRHLGAKRWKTLHRLAYVGTLGGVAHYLCLVKADYSEPLTYLGIWAALLLLRLPWLQRRKNSMPIRTSENDFT